jgi:hypothetical protein
MTRKASRALVPLVAAATTAAAIAVAAGTGIVLNNMPRSAPAQEKTEASDPAGPAQTAQPGAPPAQPADKPAAPATETDPAAPPSPPDAAVTTEAAPTGDAVSFADPALMFHAVLPDGPANDPVLTFLRGDAERYLARIKTNATADHDRLKREGVNAPPWEVKIRWNYTARAGDIVSLAGEASEYTGGAHPMLYFDTHIAHADSGDKVAMADMLIIKRSPSPAMQIAICEALKIEKEKRIKSATIFDEPIVCAGAQANAKTEAALLALAPSNEPDKFGGVYAYYPPYAVGSNAEGAYRLTVQQSIFAEDLKPDYKPLFAGEAPPLAN